VVSGVRLVVLGKQGAGKGTQCVRLSHHYVVAHVSTGDMLRAAVKSRTEVGRRAQSLMDEGELVPDELIMEVVEQRLSQNDARTRGFVLDGAPRTIAQAKMLEEILAPETLDLVIDLDVPTQMVMRRLASRRVCEDCGTNYSVSTPPTIRWICDLCGGQVVQRDDDTEEAISRRLELYRRQTKPLLEFYAQANLLVTVNGAGAPDQVTRRAVRAIDDALLADHGRPPSEG
jgi:adenylate kinase